MAWLLTILKGIATALGLIHDKNVADGAKAEDMAAAQNQILKETQNAETIRDKPDIPDDLLLPPDQRGHNND